MILFPDSSPRICSVLFVSDHMESLRALGEVYIDYADKDGQQMQLADTILSGGRYLFQKKWRFLPVIAQFKQKGWYLENRHPLINKQHKVVGWQMLFKKNHHKASNLF